MNEVASISRISYVNIVTSIGFCLQGSKRTLLYDFMSHGSVEKFIYAMKSNVRISLICKRLYEIAIRIARGLEYLHWGCNTQIVHFNIKPCNILLDKDFVQRPQLLG